MTVPAWVAAFGRLVGAIGYLAVGFFYLTAGLVVPLFPWLLILNAVWAFGLVVMLRSARRRWWAPLVATVSAVLFWVGFLFAGDALLGWTA